MAYNNKRMLRDADGAIIPQVYNAEIDEFIPLTVDHFQYNESVRVANEEQRQLNEEQRATTFDNYKTDLEEATDNAQQAATNATDKATELENRVDTAIAETTDSAEIIDARQGLDGENHPNLKSRLDAMQGPLMNQEQQTSTLQHGTNVIETDMPSPLVPSVYGNTLVNLLGKDGNMEDVSKWADATTTHNLDSANAKYGNNAFKVTLTGASGFLNKGGFPVENGKYYLLVADLKNYNATNLRVFVSQTGNGTVYGTNVNSTTYGLSYLKFESSDVIAQIGMNITGAADQYGYVDGIRFLEIDQATYDAIGVTLDDQDVERLFPYVDGMQSIKNPVLSVESGNLAPSFYEWINYSGDKRVNNPYEAVVTETDKLETYLDTVGNQSYTFTMESDSPIKIAMSSFDKNGQQIGGTRISNTESNPSITEVSEPNATKIRVAVLGDNSMDRVVRNPMLTLGTEPKPFVPRNPSYLYAECTLSKLGDKRDHLFYNDSKNRYEITKWVEHITLDGSEDWTLLISGDGYTTIEVSSYYYGKKDVGVKPLIEKYDGSILEVVASSNVFTKGDQTSHSNNSLRISVSDEDATGYDLTTTTGIKNFLSDKNYFLSYQLAEPETLVEGIDFPYVEGDLSIQGDAQVSVSSGVVVREGVEPKQHSSGKYLINEVGITANADDSPLRYKLKKFIQIYKNGQADLLNWKLYSVNSNGLYYAEIDEKDFDPNATYTVTYEVLDKHDFTTNVNDVEVTYQQTLKSAFQSVVTKQSDMATDISVNKNTIIDIYARLKALEGGV